MDLSGSEKAAADSDSAFRNGTPVASVKLTDESSTEQLEVRKNKDLYYAKSNVAEGAYKVDASLGDALNKKLEDFRNKKLFDFGFADPGKMELRSASKSYSLMRGGQDWWDNGKKMDEDSVRSVVSDLRDLSADKFVDSGFTTPEVEATVISDGGKHVEKLQISRSGSNYIAKRENDPTLYQLTANSVSDLEKALDGIKLAVSQNKPGK